MFAITALMLSCRYVSFSYKSPLDFKIKNNLNFIYITLHKLLKTYQIIEFIKKKNNNYYDI